MPTANRLGIDFSTNHFDVSVLGSNGRPLAPPKRFSHDVSGSQAALDFIQRTCQAHPADELLIGGEATGLLWWHLFHRWAADPSLAQLQPTFYLLNPKRIHNFREDVDAHDKTDKLDAELIANYLGMPDWLPHPWINCPEAWPLRFLTRLRCHLAHNLAAYKTYAYSWLYVKANTYAACKPFSDTFGKASLDILLQHPTLDALADLPLADLAEQIDILGRHRFPDPLENAKKLQAVARTSYPTDLAIADVAHFALGQVIETIRFLEKRLAVVDERIAQHTQDNADINNLRSIPGIGPVYAAGLAAELQPTQRFLTGTVYDPQLGRERAPSFTEAQAAVAKLAGLWWPRRDSGKLKGEDRSLSKAGNAYLRYYLIEAADRVRGNEAEYGAFYERKRKEATKHHHHRALVLTARKLARLVFALLHKHETYQARSTEQN